MYLLFSEEILEDGHEQHGPASYYAFLQGSDRMHQHALLLAKKTRSGGAEKASEGWRKTCESWFMKAFYIAQCRACYKSCLGDFIFMSAVWNRVRDRNVILITTELTK